MTKWLTVAVLAGAFTFSWTALATPVVEEADVTNEDEVRTLTGTVLDGHDDAYLTYEDPTQTVTTLTGFIPGGSYDQYYTPSGDELFAGDDCSAGDDLNETIWALILDLDDLWIFLV